MWINREDLKKREGKNCRGNNHKHPLKKGQFFHPSRLQDFPNHFSILLHLSVIFLLLINQEILLQCLLEYHDDGVSL